NFRYPLTEHDVLEDVSVRVERGQTLALVGENGAGKSTIVKLIAGLYRPTAGVILVNGMDAARFSPSSLRGEMSTVFQDFGKYQMTVRENLALGRVESVADDAALSEAVDRAGADEFIAA